MAGALSKFTTSPFHCLKSVQLCSWLTVRSIYTSDMKFSLQVCDVSPSAACLIPSLIFCTAANRADVHVEFVSHAHCLWHLYALQTLPPDMALSHALDSSAFEYIWLPREPKDVKDADIM
jgi:hypothetical protein